MHPSSALFCSIYREIEEVGWEHLVHLEEDLATVTFRILDKNGQSHVLEIELPHDYPKFPPSISADVPHICNLKWSTKSRLKDVVEQFNELLGTLQEFWSVMGEIDQSLIVIDPRQSSRAASYRCIDLGNEVYLLVSINPHCPRSLPEFRFLGAGSVVESLHNKWMKNQGRWKSELSVPENLASVLEITLPGPSKAVDNPEVECGICYATCLPIDDELGPWSGSTPDYTCDSANCRKHFHSLCLKDWLRSITTTRQSFDVLFGKCPYCSDPVAVKVDGCR